VKERKNQSYEVVGLSYSEGVDSAPFVTVKGIGADAEIILKLARRYTIPIVSDPYLVKALRNIERNHLIPPLLYKAVAIIFARLQGVLDKGKR